MNNENKAYDLGLNGKLVGVITGAFLTTVCKAIVDEAVKEDSFAIICNEHRNEQPAQPEVVPNDMVQREPEVIEPKESKSKSTKK